MKNVLLIWEMCPEHIEWYAISVDEEVYAKLVKCHGKLVNCGDFEDGLDDWISEYIAAIPAELKVYCSLLPGEPVQLAGSPMTVIHTGFAL